MESVTPEGFRTLMSHIASGVTVITAVDRRRHVGAMTASAVTAVSLEPPLLSVCVNHHDPLHELMRRAVVFVVNALGKDQENLSRRFSGAPENRFNNVSQHEGPKGVPLINGVVAQIVCEPWQAVPAGDHTIFLGRVTGGTSFDRSPLLHYRGQYTTTSDLP
jgi:flavin reductase (DIM6/NTAB) family NADH-FMN oxidoreductase RutF